jgi:hypothetical protein
MTHDTPPADALALRPAVDTAGPPAGRSVVETLAAAPSSLGPLPAAQSLPVLQVVQSSGALRILAVLSTFLLSALLGLVIARKAYQGYAATRSKPMLYLAVGIVLLTAVPALLSTVLTNLTALPGYQVVLVTNGAEILGLLSVAYSLYGDF